VIDGLTVEEEEQKDGTDKGPEEVHSNQS
jgi:hypothetical protein